MWMFIQLVLLFLINGGRCLEINSFYKYLNNRANSSNVKCDVQKLAVQNALKEGEPWALKMLDAFGRIPPAITQGNDADMGNYDQCINIYEKLEDVDIYGRYCYSGLIVPISIDAIDISSINLTEEIRNQAVGLTKTSKAPSTIVTVAVCIPDACLPSGMFQFGIDLSCRTKKETEVLDTGDIAFLVFIAVIVILIILSTSYDVFLRIGSEETAHDILLAFSIYTNGEKIIKTTKREGQIPFFDELKVLSMFWVTMGHRYGTFQTFVVNRDEVQNFKEQWYSLYVQLAPLAVDTFLFVSGALLSYGFLKTMQKRNRPSFNIFLYYLHRFLRLTPALAVLYFAHMTIIQKISPGPIKNLFADILPDTACEDNWWSFFLYIQNYVATNNMCLLYTWYLSLDMQLFVISPILLLPMLRFGKIISSRGIPLLVIIIIIYTMLIFHFNDISNSNSDNYYNLYYYLTHTRATPWLIGLIFGAFILDYQKAPEQYKIKSMPLIFIICGSAVAIIAILFYSQHYVQNNSTTLRTTIYFPLQRPVWALFLCWVSYACMNGNGAFLNTFLSATIFQILAKITYSTYLVHNQIILLQFQSIRTLQYFSNYNSIRIVIADICVSYAFGTLWTLAFESPIITIEKVIFGRRNKPRTLNKNITNNTGEANNETGRRVV